MSISPVEVAYEQAHLSESRQPVIYGVVITFYVIALASVVVRFISRARGPKTQLGLDDYLMFLAVVSLGVYPRRARS